jgi:hypothetical protein
MIDMQMNTTALRNILHSRSEVPKINFFRDVTSCSPADIYQHFRGTCSLYFHGIKANQFSALKMETAGSSEVLLCIYQTILHHTPEDSNLQTY